MHTGIWRLDQRRTGFFKRCQGGKPQQLQWKRFIEQGIKGSPIVIGRRLVVASTRAETYYFLFLDSASVQRWVPRKHHASPQARNQWNPTIHKNKLIGLYGEGGVSYLSVYDIDSRGLLWQAKIFGRSDSPLIDNDRVFVSGQNEVAAYSIVNGRNLWHCYLPVGLGISPPTLASDLIIVYTLPDGVFAIERNSGRLRWLQSVEKGFACPCAGSDAVFIVSHGAHQKGTVYALRIDDGRILWRQVVDGGDASPAFDGEYLYVAGLGGDLTCLSAKTGKVGWRFRMRSGTSCSPSVSVSTVYIGDSKGYLYAIDKNTGRLLWEYQTQNAVVGSPWILMNSVLFTSSDGYVYSFAT